MNILRDDIFIYRNSKELSATESREEHHQAGEYSGSPVTFP